MNRMKTEFLTFGLIYRHRLSTSIWTDISNNWNMTWRRSMLLRRQWVDWHSLYT